MTPGQALLHRAIDYAGLFPPAALDLQTTVSNYQKYLDSPHAWALGRLVLPVALAGDFAKQWPSLVAKAAISVVVGDSAPERLIPLKDLGFSLDFIECAWTEASEADRLQNIVAPNAKAFFEIPVSPDPEGTIHALAARGACAKMRTGGTVANVIPPVSEVVRFIASCARHKVPFKATAGLHHPFRGEYALTYERNSERAIMHGYVNVILASAVLYEGGDIALACEVLSDASPTNFRFDSEAIVWHNRVFTIQEITNVRQRLLLSFGSCSFLEPLVEIAELEVVC
jgi:hypothetical protein